MIQFSRLQALNLSSKIGLVKYGNIVKLSLKLWTMLPTIATLLSLCMKVSVEIETSLRFILQISSYCFKSLTMCDMLVSCKWSSSIVFLPFDLVRLQLQPEIEKKHESGSNRLCGSKLKSRVSCLSNHWILAASPYALVTSFQMPCFPEKDLYITIACIFRIIIFPAFFFMFSQIFIVKYNMIYKSC